MKSFELIRIFIYILIVFIAGCSGSGEDDKENSVQGPSDIEISPLEDQQNIDQSEAVSQNLTSVQIAKDFELIKKFDLNILISNPISNGRAYFNLCHAKVSDSLTIDYENCVYRGGIPSSGIDELLTLTNQSLRLIAEIRLFNEQAQSLQKIWVFNPDSTTQTLTLP